MKQKRKRLCLLHNTIRGDEKLLIEAAKKSAADMDVVDVTDLILQPKEKFPFDVVLDRCISTTKGIHAGLFFEGLGIPYVNTVAVAQICEDKFATSMLLSRHKIPTVDFAMVFSIVQAKKAIFGMGGYPVVIKPTTGSWGRLVNRVNDDDALESIIEHKDTFGGPIHKSYYLQKFIKKPGRDIRAVVINNRPICAIYRISDHWVTNTARGGKTAKCKITKEMGDICVRTSKAIGGGVLAMDLFESNGGLLVNEVNHKLEFKHTQPAAGVDVASRIIQYCLEVAK